MGVRFAIASTACLILAASSLFAAEGTTNVAKLMLINEARREITLNHGGIERLGIAHGNTAFRLSDTALLNRLSLGDIVQFEAERIDGVPTLTSLAKFDGEYDDHAH